MTRRIRITWIELIVGVAILVVILATLWPFLKYVPHIGHSGHYATVRIEGGMQPQLIVMGNGQTGVTTTYVPEHDEQQWVCDTCGRRP